jgi:hypothetical protein
MVEIIGIIGGVRHYAPQQQAVLHGGPIVARKLQLYCWNSTLYKNVRGYVVFFKMALIIESMK